MFIDNNDRLKRKRFNVTENFIDGCFLFLPRIIGIVFINVKRFSRAGVKECECIMYNVPCVSMYMCICVFMCIFISVGCSLLLYMHFVKNTDAVVSLKTHQL